MIKQWTLVAIIECVAHQRQAKVAYVEHIKDRAKCQASFFGLNLQKFYCYKEDLQKEFKRLFFQLSVGYKLVHTGPLPGGQYRPFSMEYWEKNLLQYSLLDKVYFLVNS